MEVSIDRVNVWALATVSAQRMLHAAGLLLLLTPMPKIFCNHPFVLKYIILRFSPMLINLLKHVILKSSFKIDESDNADTSEIIPYEIKS